METNTNNVALTILEQLGGARFVAMVGAKSMTYTPNALNMRIGKNAKRVTHVHVTLRADDTYSVVFLNARGHNVTEKARVEHVYADTLRTVFERETGLYTSL